MGIGKRENGILYGIKLNLKMNFHFILILNLDYFFYTFYFDFLILFLSIINPQQTKYMYNVNIYTNKL